MAEQAATALRDSVLRVDGGVGGGGEEVAEVEVEAGEVGGGAVEMTELGGEVAADSVRGDGWVDNPILRETLERQKRAREEAASQDGEGNAGGGGAEEVAGGQAGGDEVLPPGWERSTEEGTGRAYYHHESGAVTWERPEADSEREEAV